MVEGVQGVEGPSFIPEIITKKNDLVPSSLIKIELIRITKINESTFKLIQKKLSVQKNAIKVIFIAHHLLLNP